MRANDVCTQHADTYDANPGTKKEFARRMPHTAAGSLAD